MQLQTDHPLCRQTTPYESHPIRRESSTPKTTILLTLALCLLGAGSAAAVGPDVAPAMIAWEAVPGFSLTLSISGPGGFHRQAFEQGIAPRFGIFNESGELHSAGVYTWELAETPRLKDDDKAALQKARETGGEVLEAINGFTRSGYFTIADGAFVDLRVKERDGEHE